MHDKVIRDAEESAGGLPDELRALGRAMRVPGTDGDSMAERVLAQLLAEAVPTPVLVPPGRVERLRDWLRRRWRAGAAVFSGLLVVLVLTPPVRAAVADWFDFGGVRVRYDPSASPLPGAPVAGCGRPVTSAEAASRAGFIPRVPTELGPPDSVALTGVAGGGYGVTLCWSESGRTIRLDEFAASLDLGWAKQVRAMPEFTQVGGGTGLWFQDPHLLDIRLVAPHGGGWTETRRTAGPTLLWDDRTGQTLTLRLEGVASLSRALSIANSLAKGSR